MAEDKTGYTVDLDSFKRIGRVVREVETNMGLPPRTYRRARFIGPTVEGIMLEDLAGTADPNAPTKARFQIKSALHGNDEWVNEPAPSILTLWNRTTATASVDQPVFAVEMYPDRWYLLSGAGGGSHHIEFMIEDVYCPNDEDNSEGVLFVVATWLTYTGGCNVDPPGVDEYTGLLRIYDTCVLAWYTPEQLIGKVGYATYLYPRDTGNDPYFSCVPKWKALSICGEPECA